jgi:hypothetical protein
MTVVIRITATSKAAIIENWPFLFRLYSSHLSEL